ncbi:hypothetical protein [Pseudomonas sp. P1.8]|uniref:hypothetical protein n=1 Tax=Pseudomonas sp. P1.8 TaxID=1699310 RepID=UPI0012E24730|nr:hypothetical protein [Pseudomonas sp. P1.8]
MYLLVLKHFPHTCVKVGSLHNQRISAHWRKILDGSFYAEIQQMVKAAVAALDSAEMPSSKVDTFGPCRSIAAACRDGAHLDSSIRNDLGPKRKYEFESALTALSQFNMLSNSPGANPGIRNCLARVARMTAELEAEATASEPPQLPINHFSGTLGAR